MIKKITIISSYFAPAWSYGGPPKVLFTLAKYLVKKSINVDVITTDSLGELRNKCLVEKLEGIKVHRFKNLSNTLAYKTNFFYAKVDKKLVKKILTDTDIVLFGDVRNIFNWQLYKYVEKTRIPYGVFSFGEIPQGAGVKSLFKTFMDKCWTKKFIQKATYLFAQTEHEKEMYEQYFDIPRGSVHMLVLPVELKSSKANTVKIKKLMEKWQLNKRTKVIIFVGRINYLKGIDILIKSIADLLRNDNDLKLLIIGRDDGYLATLKDLVSDDISKQILFTGPLFGDDVEAAYFLSSCFVITPRHFEETSTAALEALSVGVPVVVTKEAEIPYLTHYKAGFIVNNNSLEISDAIKKVLYTSLREKERMNKEAKNCIKENFLAEKVTDKLIEILSSSK